MTEHNENVELSDIEIAEVAGGDGPAVDPGIVTYGNISAF